MKLLVPAIAFATGLCLGFLACLVVIATGRFAPLDISGAWGKFPQPPRVELLDEGRSLKLLEDFVYIDPRGRTWSAPKDYVVNGASIPQVFWTTGLGPLEGKYRNASIIHDVACDRRNAEWENVHLMFYEASRCGGVAENQAKLLYAAVYNFGPRWVITEQESPILAKTSDGETRQLNIQRKASKLVPTSEPTKENQTAVYEFAKVQHRSVKEIKEWSKEK